MPSDHHHAGHERGTVHIMSQVIEQIAKNVDHLTWECRHADHEIRGLRRDVEELRFRQGKTQEALEIFMASFVWEHKDDEYPIEF